MKIKGVGEEMVAKTTLKELKALLILESSKIFYQKKWFKNVFTGKIQVLEVTYELKATANKRHACYTTISNKDGVKLNLYTHSEPLNYADIEVLAPDNE